MRAWAIAAGDLETVTTDRDSVAREIMAALDGMPVGSQVTLTVTAVDLNMPVTQGHTSEAPDEQLPDV